MKRLRPPAPCLGRLSRSPVDALPKTAAFARRGGQSPPRCPDVVQPVSSQLRRASRKDGVGSPLFPGSPPVSSPCSSTPVESARLGRSLVVPMLSPVPSMGGPRPLVCFRGSIARLRHSLCTLRARLSTDCATLASGWLACLCRSGIEPAGLLKNVSASRCSTSSLFLPVLRVYQGATWGRTGRRDPGTAAALSQATHTRSIASPVPSGIRTRLTPPRSGACARPHAQRVSPIAGTRWRREAGASRRALTSAASPDVIPACLNGVTNYEKEDRRILV